MVYNAINNNSTFERCDLMRTSGILMPIFSLASPYGIGTFGKKALEFVDFLSKSGQSHWQILPLNPTDYGDSPYQSFSSYAGNSYFIDLEMLENEGLLKSGEAKQFDFGSDPHSVDYSKLFENRNKVLKLAFSKFTGDKEYNNFCKKNAYWLEDYSLFKALKFANNGKPWYEWDKPLKFRESSALENAKITYKSEIEFEKFVQFKFNYQWKSLKEYANEKNINIIGDIPIYVALDSADVWSSPELFMLDNEFKPTFVAGCPPDGFTENGQLWGNPLYNWDKMKKDNFLWWKSRLGYALQLYDTVRIDHFRGFESFYAIPFGEKTARNGHWIKGPDIEFFDEMKNEFGNDISIIAEDLGFLTEEVEEMLEKTGFPGMKVLQFGFDGANNYLPHNYTKNCVVYTGTHDNDTIVGWRNNADKSSVKFAEKYMHHNESENINWTMLRTALMSVADTAILMMPDFLGLGSEARINTPSTLGDNWKWRIADGCINDWLAKIIYDNTALYERLPNKKEE